MASLKALKMRINSVKSTQKITKAMKMVAAAKLRRATEAAEASRPYAERLEAVVSSIASKVTVGPQSPKLLAGSGNSDVHLFVVATSDKGLAGAFNTNIVRLARRQAEALKAEGRPSNSTPSERKAATSSAGRSVAISSTALNQAIWASSRTLMCKHGAKI